MNTEQSSQHVIDTLKSRDLSVFRTDRPSSSSSHGNTDELPVENIKQESPLETEQPEILMDNDTNSEITYQQGDYDASYIGKSTDCKQKNQIKVGL